jgi:DNA polymerase-3 subunit alpha/error-prone DNA polymerase
MVVLQPVTFRTKKSLICIKSSGNWQQCHFIKTYRNRLLQDIRNNGSIKELLEKFSDHPKIIENTECIIAECNFEFEFKTPKKQNILYRQWRKWHATTNTTCKWGFDKIYGNTNVLARARVEKELKVIDELKFSGYF